MENSEWYKNLPKKPVGAGILLFNSAKELLLVKPTYKDGWEIPGGFVEAEESPLEACRREIREELSIETIIKRLVCVDFQGPPKDNFQFLFVGETLTTECINSIKLQNSELSEYKFVNVEDVTKYTLRGLQVRLPICIEAALNERFIYLENGYLPL